MAVDAYTDAETLSGHGWTARVVLTAALVLEGGKTQREAVAALVNVHYVLWSLGLGLCVKNPQRNLRGVHSFPKRRPRDHRGDGHRSCSWELLQVFPWRCTPSSKSSCYPRQADVPLDSLHHTLIDVLSDGFIHKADKVID